MNGLMNEWFNYDKNIINQQENNDHNSNINIIIISKQQYREELQ